MGKVKAEAIRLIESLPDDCTWEELRYRLQVVEAVEEGLAAVAAGRVIPHDEAKRQAEEWLQSSGLIPPPATPG